MASIITATTTSGLTHSADNSGVLQLASGTGNLVTVPSVTGTAMVSGNMPAFGAFSSVGTSISANTWTKLNFNSEEFDTANAFDSTTNFRFTPQVNGYYQINAAWQSSATSGNAYIAIYKNGSIAKFGSVLVAGTVGCEPVVSSLIALNGSTDYIEIYAFASVSSTATSQAINTYVNGYLARTA